MRIHLYTICWNEARVLPYFLRHYEQFCDAIIVYDNGSDDGSIELVASHPLCELRHLDSPGGMEEGNLLRVKGQEWKECRGVADWVIACDVDEFLFHPAMRKFLGDCQAAGVTLPPPSGFQMISDRFPEHEGQIYNAIQTGFPDKRFNKRVVFNPNAIRDMNYTPGCHRAAPDGDVHELADPELKLLHFKFLGIEYTIQRFAALDRRRCASDRAGNFSHHYATPPDTLRSEFAENQKRAELVDLGRADLNATPETVA